MTPQYQAYRSPGTPWDATTTTYWIPTANCLDALEWAVREDPQYRACVRRIGMDPVEDLRECTLLLRELMETLED